MPIKRDSRGRFAGGGSSGGSGGGGRSHAFIARVGSGKSVAGGRVSNQNKAFKRKKTNSVGITRGAARYGLNSTTRSSAHAKFGDAMVSRRATGRNRLRASNAARRRRKK